MKRSPLQLIFLLFLCSIVVSLLKTDVVRGNLTIYIRFDGSIDPSTAPISNMGNITYIFTGLINCSIVVERDDILIDGNNNIVQGKGSETGIDLTGRNNVTIKKVDIEAFTYGIKLYDSSNNRICQSSIRNNEYGIHLAFSSSNIISENNVLSNKVCGIRLGTSSDNALLRNKVSSNVWGVKLYMSSYNIISRNKITYNENGVELIYSPNNTVSGNNIGNNWAGISLIGYTDNNSVCGNNITSNENGVWFNYGYMFENKFYHNNFIDNTKQRSGLSSLFTGNFWDNRYPYGGNYWSDYIGADEKSGPNQDQPGSDGIGDSSYEIEKNITDYYPLMGMFHSFNISSICCIDVISNSTIENFHYSESDGTIRFYVSNAAVNQSHVFCRLTIPHVVLCPPYNITINNVSVPCASIFENETHSLIYFSFEHSTHEIIIVPEFPTMLISTLFMMATLLAVMVYGRKHNLPRSTTNSRALGWLP